MPTLEATLTSSQAAERLGLSKQRILQLADDGTLACLRTPLGLLFRPDVVDDLARRRAERAQPSEPAAA